MSAPNPLSSLIPSGPPSELTIDFGKNGSVSEVTLKYGGPDDIQDSPRSPSGGYKPNQSGSCYSPGYDTNGSKGKPKPGSASSADDTFPNTPGSKTDPDKPGSSSSADDTFPTAPGSKAGTGKPGASPSADDTFPTAPGAKPASGQPGTSSSAGDVFPTAPASKAASGSKADPGSGGKTSGYDAGKVKSAIADLLDALGLGGLADMVRGSDGKGGAPSCMDSTPSGMGSKPSGAADAPSGKAGMPSGADKKSSGSSGGTYNVKEGQTLSDVAVANHVSVSQIMQANPEITDADKIKAGQTLKLPGTGDKEDLPADLDKNAQTTPLSDEETKQRADNWVADLQKDLGLTKEQATGVVANLCHESFGLNPGIQQGGKLGDPSMEGDVVNQTGYGICQWGEIRKQGLIDYARQQGLPASSEAAQYGYFKQEFQYQYKNSLNAVKASKTADEALQAFCTGFLVPSDPQLDQRKQWIGSDGSIAVPSSRPHATA